MNVWLNLNKKQMMKMYEYADRIKEHYQRATERLIKYAARHGQPAIPYILDWLYKIDKGYTDQKACRYLKTDISTKPVEQLEKIIFKGDVE